MNLKELFHKNEVFEDVDLLPVKLHAENSNIGLISASRSEYNSLENASRTEQLKRDIINAHYGYIEVIGSYIENVGTNKERKVIENSFLVIEQTTNDTNLFEFLKLEASKFDQETFIFKTPNIKAAFFNSSGSKVHVAGNFHIGSLGDYHSEFKGKKFSFAD